MYQWYNLYFDLFFDAFWSNHPLGGVVFALFIKVNAHNSPRDIFTFESSFDQMWDLGFDEHLFDAFLGCWVFAFQKFTPWSKITEWKNSTTSEKTESMCLNISVLITKFRLIEFWIYKDWSWSSECRWKCFSVWWIWPGIRGLEPIGLEPTADSKAWSEVQSLN